jgi:hypothetical protein
MTKRRMRPEIMVRAEQVEIALQHSHVLLDSHAAIALLVVGVELLEGEHSHERLRLVFDQILDARIERDPRADTRGT